MIVISDICRLRNDEKVSPDKIRNPKERVRENGIDILYVCLQPRLQTAVL